MLFVCEHRKSLYLSQETPCSPCSPSGTKQSALTACTDKSSLVDLFVCGVIPLSHSSFISGYIVSPFLVQTALLWLHVFFKSPPAQFKKCHLLFSNLCVFAKVQIRKKVQIRSGNVFLYFGASLFPLQRKQAKSSYLANFSWCSCI